MGEGISCLTHIHMDTLMVEGGQLFATFSPGYPGGRGNQLFATYPHGHPDGIGRSVVCHIFTGIPWWERE